MMSVRLALSIRLENAERRLETTGTTVKHQLQLCRIDWVAFSYRGQSFRLDLFQQPLALPQRRHRALLLLPPSPPSNPKMAPPIIGFDASELRERIQVDACGKGRKPTAGQRGGFDLARCELLEMLQYKCTVEGPHNRDAMVQCWPVARWFRRYVSISSLV